MVIQGIFRSAGETAVCGVLDPGLRDQPPAGRNARPFRRSVTLPRSATGPRGG
jgi:hypothetical protein